MGSEGGERKREGKTLLESPIYSPYMEHREKITQMPSDLFYLTMSMISESIQQLLELTDTSEANLTGVNSCNL